MPGRMLIKIPTIDCGRVSSVT
nr:hypothetical protein [Tanacetum cinerariifolium]